MLPCVLHFEDALKITIVFTQFGRELIGKDAVRLLAPRAVALSPVKARGNDVLRFGFGVDEGARKSAARRQKHGVDLAEWRGRVRITLRGQRGRIGGVELRLQTQPDVGRNGQRDDSFARNGHLDPVTGDLGRSHLVVTPAACLAVAAFDEAAVQANRRVLIARGLVYQGKIELAVAVRGEPIELSVVAGHQAARQPQPHGFVAIELTGRGAVDAHAEAAAGGAFGGESDRAVRTHERLGHQPVNHGTGEVPRVPGIHRGEVPLPRRSLYGIGTFGDERDDGSVVAGIVAETSDHAVARDVSQERVVAQSGHVQQRSMRVHPILHWIGRRREAQTRDAPCGGRLFRRGYRLWCGETPDVLVPTKGMLVHGGVPAGIHQHVFVRRRGVKIQFRRFAIGHGHSGTQRVCVVRGVVEFEQVRERLLGVTAVGHTHQARSFHRGFERSAIAGEPPARETVGDGFGLRAFCLGQRSQDGAALLQQAMQAQKLRVTDIRRAEVARSGLHDGAIDAFIG